MSKPVIPLDAELAKIFGNNTRIFRAMRELFKQAGDLSPAAIEEALITAGNAGTAANQALDTIERITQAIELIALMPRVIDNIAEDDLTPKIEFVVSDSLSELAPVADQAGTDNSTNVTLAGTPNYITIVGQVITRALINLTSHVTDILSLANGGTNDAAVSAANIGHLKAMDQDVGANDEVDFNKVTIETTAGGVLNLQRDDTSVGSNDLIGEINFVTNDATNSGNAGIIRVDVNGSSANGRMYFELLRNGVETNIIFLDANKSATFRGDIITEGDLIINSGGEAFLNLPAVSTGTSGSLWSDSGTVKVVP